MRWYHPKKTIFPQAYFLALFIPKLYSHLPSLKIRKLDYDGRSAKCMTGYIMSTMTSLKSSLLPSCKYSWSAFLVAKSAKTCALWRRGETVMCVSRIMVAWFQEKRVSISTPWTISQKSHEQAIVIIEAFPVKDHSLIFLSCIMRKTSISSPQTRLCSIYLMVGFEISLMCWGFVA